MITAETTRTDVQQSLGANTLEGGLFATIHVEIIADPLAITHGVVTTKFRWHLCALSSALSFPLAILLLLLLLLLRLLINRMVTIRRLRSALLTLLCLSTA